MQPKPALATSSAIQTVPISPSQLPGSHNQIFSRSSFFNRGSTALQLPIPKEVRAQGARQQYPHTWPPTTVIFSGLDLLVKYGRKTSIAEGQCLWMVRTYLGDKVPVPEVYGWCQDGEEVFIYMELIRGCTLEQGWNRLSEPERFGLCAQLSTMVTALRELRQDPGASHIGTVMSGPLQDIVFEGQTVGPFPNTSEFHDFFAHPNWGEPAASQTPEEIHPMRSDLPDDPIYLAHADLHRSNIMITSEGQAPRILAIVDWHQSGWYPAYWEYCKAKWSVHHSDEWASKYLPKVIEPQPEAYHAWNCICLFHGV